MLLSNERAERLLASDEEPEEGFHVQKISIISHLKGKMQEEKESFGQEMSKLIFPCT